MLLWRSTWKIFLRWQAFSKIPVLKRDWIQQGVLWSLIIPFSLPFTSGLFCDHSEQFGPLTTPQLASVVIGYLLADRSTNFYALQKVLAWRPAHNHLLRCTPGCAWTTLNIKHSMQLFSNNQRSRITLHSIPGVFWLGLYKPSGFTQLCFHAKRPSRNHFHFFSTL